MSDNVCPVCGKTRTMPIKLPDCMGGRTMIVGVMCDCEEREYRKEQERVKQREAQMRIANIKGNSMMDEAFRSASFAESKLTQGNKQGMDIAKAYVGKFGEMLDSGKGLLFYGNPGTGKTHIAACIANALMEKGVSVMMTSFVTINSLEFDDADALISRMKNTHLLILDDLGAERSTDTSIERVYNVIDSRIRSKLPMIITTNLSIQKLNNREDTRYWRIYDRIKPACFPVLIGGGSYREYEAVQMQKQVKEMLGV